VLRATLEADASPEIERSINESRHLVTSRLSLVESARAFLRLRALGEVPETALADAENSVHSVWRRCEIIELSAAVCEIAERVAPGGVLRALDALHLASFLVARRQIEDLTLLTTDRRLLAAIDGL